MVIKKKQVEQLIQTKKALSLDKKKKLGKFKMQVNGKKLYKNIMKACVPSLTK